LFFVLELNRIDDAKLQAAMQDRSLVTTAVAGGHPQGQAISSSRIASSSFSTRSRSPPIPREPAVRRDHRQPALQGRPKTLAIEATLNLMQDRRPAMRKAASQALAKTFQAAPAQPSR